MLAGPPSVIYKFTKFIRRNRVAVVAASLVVAALVIGLSVATVGLVRARQEARRSQRIAGEQPGEKNLAASATLMELAEVLQNRGE